MYRGMNHASFQVCLSFLYFYITINLSFKNFRVCCWLALLSRKLFFGPALSGLKVSCFSSCMNIWCNSPSFPVPDAFSTHLIWKEGKKARTPRRSGRGGPLHPLSLTFCTKYLQRSVSFLRECVECRPEGVSCRKTHRLIEWKRSSET